MPDVQTNEPAASPEASPAGEEEPRQSDCRLVIAAACRSGTKYTAEVFSRSGVHAGHEAMFRELGFHGWGGWEMDVSCWVPHYEEAFSELSEKGILRPMVLHQVRDPLKSVNSNAAHWEHFLEDSFRPGARKRSEQADHQRYPMLRRYSKPIEIALAYYVLQNEAIERLGPSFRFRVEDIDAHFVSMILADPLRRETSNLESRNRIQCALEMVPKDMNPLPDYVNRGMYHYQIGDLPEIPERERFVRMVKEYGYGQYVA